MLGPIAMVLLLAQAPAGDVAKSYRCGGVVEGKAYALELGVEPWGEGYKFSWGANGTVAYVGYGLRHGAVIAVVLTTGQGQIALAAYEVKRGELAGKWMAGDGVVHVESCLVGSPA